MSETPRTPSLDEVFGTPFNWCDRRCERCPLTADCRLYRREQGQRWVHEARGRDPDSPEAVQQDMAYDIDLMERIVREVAAEEGIDLNEPLPERPTVLAAKRLERASMTVVRKVAELVRAHPQAEEVASELRALSFTLARKVAGIAGRLEDDVDEETRARDSAPHLLLIDRVRADFAEQLAQIAQNVAMADAVVQAMAELDRWIDPLIRQVGEPARSVLAALVARGEAPSPFLRKPATAARSGSS